MWVDEHVSELTARLETASRQRDEWVEQIKQDAAAGFPTLLGELTQAPRGKRGMFLWGRICATREYVGDEAALDGLSAVEAAIGEGEIQAMTGDEHFQGGLGDGQLELEGEKLCELDRPRRYLGPVVSDRKRGREER
jgi:hypothetical protein